MKYSINFFFAIFVALVIISCNGEKKEKSTEITVWHTESNNGAKQTLQKIANQFEKENPNVKVNIVPNSWGAQAEKIIKGLRDNSLPDIAHVQPFMVKSLVNKGVLIELDDLIQNIDSSNNKLFPKATEIGKHNNKIYGIPYAMGTTAWAYNENLSPKNLANVKTWRDFIKISVEYKKKVNSNFNIMLPGASSFFMEQLYCELLANNGGRMFDKDLNPLFDSKENIETLQFFRELKLNDLLHPNWKSQNYLDQFSQFANNETSCVLVTYARAANTITEIMKENDKIASDSIYKWMHQPLGQSAHENLASISTVDCEPWVIFKNTESDKSNLCKKFLEIFYREDLYLEFVKNVPIHLTPVFSHMASDSSYLAKIGNWESWHQQTMSYLSEENGLETRPILMPSANEKSFGFLLELQYEGIISNTLLRVLSDDNVDVNVIANNMQEEAKNFMSNNK